MLPNVGWPEMAVIAAVGALLFGAKRLPDLARNLGRSLVEFKNAVRGADEEVDRVKGPGVKERKP